MNSLIAQHRRSLDFFKISSVSSMNFIGFIIVYSETLYILDTVIKRVIAYALTNWRSRLMAHFFELFD